MVAEALALAILVVVGRKLARTNFAHAMPVAVEIRALAMLTWTKKPLLQGDAKMLYASAVAAVVVTDVYAILVPTAVR